MAEEKSEIGKILSLACTANHIVVIDHHQKLYALNLDNRPLIGWELIPRDICAHEAVVEQPEHIGQC